MSKEFDLYCIMCNGLLSIDSHSNREFCKSCWKIYKKEYNNRLYHMQVYKKKLRKFYDFQRIPLIQSPYLTETRIIRDCKIKGTFKKLSCKKQQQHPQAFAKWHSACIDESREPVTERRQEICN